jgi:hypothetical protein
MRQKVQGAVHGQHICQKGSSHGPGDADDLFRATAVALSMLA